MIKELDEFIVCLDEERFYDAHEVLEPIWFKKRFEDCDEIKLIKGFINAAVSFELRKRGKTIQAKKVWQNYLKYEPLLYKIDTKYINKYHAVSRHVQMINNSYL
ncbi:DUF309 domain-containing protein [Sulfurimonas sp.]